MIIKVRTYKELLANMLTAAALLMVKKCKSVEIPTWEEWISKVRYMCLITNVSAMCIYRAGHYQAIVNFMSQWGVFVNSR